jgi:hypothetical protein
LFPLLRVDYLRGGFPTGGGVGGVSLSVLAPGFGSSIIIEILLLKNKRQVFKRCCANANVSRNCYQHLIYNL